MLPQPYIEELKALAHFDVDAYLTALTLPPVRGLHINLCKKCDIAMAMSAVEKELGEYALTPLPYANDGFICSTEQAVGTLPLHHAGAYYMQEPSAMCPVACLPLIEGMTVLDLCASPGGKSTQIANRIGEKGLLVSNEINHSRCAILAGNIERMGIQNAIVTNTDAKTLADYLPCFFDAVMVDAPCSGEGMFRKMPEATEEWTKDSPLLCKARQLEILSHAEKTLKKGGYLLYSTCTFSQEENEEVVWQFLKEHSNFRVCDIPHEVKEVTLPGIAVHQDTSLSLTRRFYPYHAKGEGQFMALLQKTEEPNDQKEPTHVKKSGKKAVSGRQDPKSNQDKTAAVSYIEEYLESIDPTPICPFKQGYSLLPSALQKADSFPFPLPTEYIYAMGVKIGEVRKGRLVPYHHLFTAYGKSFKTKLSLSAKDPRVYAYLKGEVVECDLPNGWACLTVEGYPLGGIKVTDGIAKNHYPTGLRNR